MKLKKILVEKNKTQVILLLLLLTAFACFGIFILKQRTNINDTYNIAQKVYINEKLFYLKIANESNEWSRGLMDVQSLQPDQGMLFIFDDNKPRSFWMKNTYIPLDIIFIDDQFRVVEIYNNTKPLDTSLRYNSILPAKYVLELTPGSAEALKLDTNDSIKLIF